jgi:hypothetical protein
MRLQVCVLLVGLCLSTSSLAQSASTSSDNCTVQTVTVTNAFGKVLETKDTIVCQEPKSVERRPGDMTAEERNADLARLKELESRYKKNAETMNAIAEKYLTPEQLERQPSLASACVASYERAGWDSSRAQPWCSCVSGNLATVLTPTERTGFLKEAEAFVASALRDPAPGQSRVWRLYSPIAACQR